MRVLSERELEITIGGYDNQNTGNPEAVTDSQIDAIAATAQNLSTAEAETFGAQQAASFGIPIGPFNVTPIFNPFSGANSIRFGVRARARC